MTTDGRQFLLQAAAERSEEERIQKARVDIEKCADDTVRVAQESMEGLAELYRKNVIIPVCKKYRLQFFNTGRSEPYFLRYRSRERLFAPSQMRSEPEAASVLKQLLRIGQDFNPLHLWLVRHIKSVKKEDLE